MFAFSSTYSYSPPLPVSSVDNTAAASPQQVCALDLRSVVKVSQVSPDLWRVAGYLSITQTVKSEDGEFTFEATEWEERCFHIDQVRERERELREAQRRV